MVGSAEQKEVIDGANGAHSFGCAEVHNSLDLLLLLCVIVQLSELLLHYLPLRESFPLSHWRKLYSFEDVSLLNTDLPVFLSQVLLHDLMAAKMRKGRPLPLVLLQHLVQQNFDLLRALPQMIAIPDDFRSGHREAINVVLVRIRVGHLPSISVVVVLF